MMELAVGLVIGFAAGAASFLLFAHWMLNAIADQESRPAPNGRAR